MHEDTEAGLYAGARETGGEEGQGWAVAGGGISVFSRINERSTKQLHQFRDKRGLCILTLIALADF